MSQLKFLENAKKHLIFVEVCNVDSQHNKYKFSYYLESILKVSEHSNSLVVFSLDVSGF